MKLPVISRKFAIVIVYLIAQTIIAFAPDSIDAKVEKYAPVAAVVVCVGIFGITLEDSVKAWAARPGNVRDAIQDLIDELLPAQPPLIPPPTTNTTVNVSGQTSSIDPTAAA